MNIYIYSDESGVFDKEHNDYFVFGGLIILGTENKDIWSRKYAAAEKAIRETYGKNELKATIVSNKDKNKLFRSLNKCHKFGVIVNQKQVNQNIFNTKKSKQRYLDYAYKIAVKRALQSLIQSGNIVPSEIERIYFYVDEHTTATDGKYELKQSLEQEFKHGTFNYHYSTFYPPIFPSLKSCELEFCNSSSKLLVRAADITANKIYYHTVRCQLDKLDEIQNLHVITLPVEQD
jgi:hypothetical protein